MSNYSILKKAIENDLKYSINSLSPDLIQLSKSINQIKQLCQNQVNVQLQLLQGDKRCLICQQNHQNNSNNNNNNQADQEDQTLVKYLRCKRCQQVYHEKCILQSNEELFQFQKSQIIENDDYNQLSELKPTFQILCLRCNMQDCFNEEINAKKINYIFQLNKICQEVRDQIYENTVEEKRKKGSCQICNILWLRRQAEHQIFECDLDNDDEFLEEIKNNQEQPLNIKKIIRLSNCKHVFCQDCLGDKVLENQILKEDYYLCCQAEDCEEQLTFPEIHKILDSKYNWLLKYKHQKFLIEELENYRDEISFVRCRGLYKLARKNCIGIKLQTRQELIQGIQEIKQLEQQIIDENSLTMPNLKKIQSVKMGDQEILKCCNRAYQVIRNNEIDMKAIFEEILNQTQCQKEKEERRILYAQYENSQIKPFPDPTINQEQDSFIITCDNENCQFQFCINGCLEPHANKNQCPNAENYNDNNHNIFKLDLNDVVKNIGASTLHFRQLDNSVILTDSVICFRCFRDIKQDTKNEENQAQHICKCFEEYNKIQEQNDHEENYQIDNDNQILEQQQVDQNEQEIN
ncbi:hypothetical protein ABPG74_014239 [Tetrahymena malaccensis]